MAFDSWSAFLAMGGHGRYVWVAYGTTFALLAGLVLVSRWRHRRWLAQQRRQHRQDAARPAATFREH